jgi:hypothetical protein
VDACKCLLLFAVCLSCLVLRAREMEIFKAATPAGLPEQAQVASVGGIVYRPQSGGAMLCLSGCVRLYGSAAPNASRASVVGVWAGRRDNSITVVRESWAQAR